MPFEIYREPASSILSATSGFIAQAGFTHSLTPARNCTFGCTYCYVPTMGIYGGLKPGDARRWGQYTTFKQNAAVLLRKALRPHQIIYCSPLVDPYQPAESSETAMPALLDVLIDRPPRVFVLQTRGALILRDLDRIEALAARTELRVSFSVTTDREDIRKLYEPHCAPIAERFEIIRQLRAAGIRTFATLAPLLPCNPEALLQQAIEAAAGDVIGDPFHIRATKRSGATTREAARRISEKRGHSDWHDADFQARLLESMSRHAEKSGGNFATGPAAFSRLAEVH